MLGAFTLHAMHFCPSVEEVNAVSAAYKNQSTEDQRECHHGSYVSEKGSLCSVNARMTVQKRFFIEFSYLLGDGEGGITTQEHLAFQGGVTACCSSYRIFQDRRHRFPVTADLF